MRRVATNSTVLDAIAKQMPCARADDRGVDADDLAPRESTSGPPELPGLSAASVCITLSIAGPSASRSDRPSAWTTPAVTVYWKPNGLPIATTSCPTAAPRSAERAKAGAVAVDAHHREVGSGSSPTSCARSCARPKGRHDLGARDHVAVGQRKAVGREEEAGAAAVDPVVGSGDLKVQDGGADAVDGADHGSRIRVEENEVLGRSGTRRRRNLRLDIAADRVENGG